jgi:hypothetical protein
MEHLSSITAQQLVIAACGGLIVASIMLSHNNRLGILPLVIAICCGLGAFAKSRSR